MKKLQNYLMKPEELRKKLENPRFRQDFIDWTKNNISVHKDSLSKHSRSRSPVERIQHSLQLNNKKQSHNNKENARPQSSLRQSVNNKSTLRTPLTQKITNSDQPYRSLAGIKRNVSNVTLSKGGEGRVSNHSLNAKNRYNSCTSMEPQKRERSVSHMNSVD